MSYKNTQQNNKISTVPHSKNT